MLEHNVRYRNGRKTEPDQQRLLGRFDRLAPPVKARNQVRDRDVQKARRRNRKHRRLYARHSGQRDIRRQRADERSEARRHIECERFRPRESRMQEDGKIAHLLRYGMRDDRERRGDPERVVGEKRRRDHDAVAEIVHAVADQDH